MSSIFSELFGDGSGLIKDPNTGKWTFEEIIGFPKLPNEGVIDYLLRILSSGQVLFNKGVWSNSPNYCVGSLVAYNSKFYVAIQSNQGVLPGSNPAIWEELLYSLEGLQGPQGESGESSTIVT